jgi:hypothetical protein
MKKVNIKLGKTPEQIPAPVGSPEGGPEFFPSLHVTSSEKLELPDKGVMLVKFRKVASSSNKPRDGEESYSCTFDIKEIIAVTGKADDDDDEVEAPAKNRSQEAGDALDAIMRDKMKSKKEKDDY